MKKPAVMSFIPEIRYDSAGNPTGVFLTMKQWAILTPVINPVIADEQRYESLRRLKQYFTSPKSALEANILFDRLKEEDNFQAL